MCADIALHDRNDGNPHCHILLTMRPLNEDTTWGAKSKKEYILDKNGEKVKLKNGNYKIQQTGTSKTKRKSGEKHGQTLQTNILKKIVYRIRWITALI